MLLENGVYRAVVRGISIYLRGENERLTAALRLECEGKELVHREWLELNDGTISDKTIKRMRSCFPKWDGRIETLEEGFCVQDVEVDVTVENEQDKDDPSKWWTRTKYMDPPGCSSTSASMPDKESRATLVSKYGARFRALAGGTESPKRRMGDGAQGTHPAPAGAGAPLPGGDPSGTAAPARATMAPSAPPPPCPPSQPTLGPTATLEECWEALCKKHPDEMREQVTDRWFKLLAEVAPGKDQADFEPQDWGKAMASIAVPF